MMKEDKKDTSKKDTAKKETEPVICCLSKDQVNLRTAKGWMKVYSRQGMEGSLCPNKRTMLRLFGNKGKK